MYSKKPNENNDPDTRSSRIRAGAAQCVAQSAARLSSTRPRALPYLWRRNGIWQFRRRLPQKIVANGSPPFVTASLRTQVLPEAMKRAAALLAAMERIETRIMAQSAIRELDAGTIRQIVAEVVREALARLAETEASVAPRTPAEADAASAGLANEIRELRLALRLRDGAPARPAVQRAISALNLPVHSVVPEAVERDALGGLLDVREAAAALDEGRSLAQATQVVRARYFDGRELGDIRPHVMISAAIVAAERSAVSKDMARKIAATGKLMLAWKGDMPLELFIEPKSVLDFLMWVRRLPKKHGQLQGNNRFRQARPEPDKHRVIADADERDRLLREMVAARDELDLRQKRAHLAKALEPRLTDDAVEKHHARLTAIVGAARSELHWRGPAFKSVLPAYRTSQRPGQTSGPRIRSISALRRRRSGRFGAPSG